MGQQLRCPRHPSRSTPISAASPTGSNLEAIYDYVARFDGVLHWNGAEILEWYGAASAGE